MSLPKPARSKRSALPRTADYTKAFLKDWERLSRSGRYDMNRLKHVMRLLIAHDGPPDPERQGHRERHVGGDFLLAYKLHDCGRYEQVFFVRAGTHADLFG